MTQPVLLSDILTPTVISRLRHNALSMVCVTVLSPKTNRTDMFFLSVNEAAEHVFVDSGNRGISLSPNTLSRNSFLYIWADDSQYRNVADYINDTMGSVVNFTHRIVLGDPQAYQTWGYVIRHDILSNMLGFAVCTKNGEDSWEILVTSEEDCVILKILAETHLKKSKYYYCKVHPFDAK